VAGTRGPRSPGNDVEEGGDAEAAGGPARQDDGLEGVKDRTEAEEQTEDQGSDSHELF
jgi:hypothetical protein